MRTLLIALTIAATPSAALTQDDIMASRYGNTTVAKGDHEVHMYYSANHTFTGKVVDVGFDLKGTWAVNGDTLCLTYDPAPPTIRNPQCQPVTPHKVGDSWTAGDRTVTLIQGIK
jgi:hypothetical protein